MAININIREIPTLDLVHELARRAEHFDALASLAADVHGSTTPIVESTKERVKFKHLLTPDMVLDCLQKSGRPLTVDEIRRRIGKGTNRAVTGHLRRLGDSKIVKVGNEKPFAFTVK